MRINHNITALNTYNKLSANQATTSKSLEKLSSGLKINRAGDNAAGLAISEKMRGQIRGLDQASANASDGISLIKTAEGALNETHSILQRMRELAVQSSNDTNTTSDRAEMQKEIAQLNSEINRISETTEFNTQKLLNGSMGSNASSATPGNVAVVTSSGMKVGDYTATVDTAAVKQVSTGATVYADDAAVATAAFTNADIKLNGIAIDLSSADTNAEVVSAFNAKSDSTGFTVSRSGNAGFVFTATEYGAGKTATVTGAQAALIGAVSSTTAGVDAVMTLTNNTDSTSTTVTGTGQSVIVGNSEFTAAGAATSSSVITVTSDGSSIHIGANKDQTMLVDIGEISTSTLGNATNKIKDISVATTTSAETAIETIDDAMKSVSSERSKLGAFQNRLEHTINNLGTSSENTAAAESRIRDVDMAKEMSEFTKNNILSQAAQAMLAQANQQPQGVLQLLQ